MNKRYAHTLVIQCPCWHSFLFLVTEDGIDVRCKSCKGAIHRLERSLIEHLWVPSHSLPISLRCPRWRSLLVIVVNDGIDVRCKSCKGIIHHLERALIEQLWTSLQQAA